MVVVYVAAAFLSATLLFAVQPLATRMVLPQFGGSAAVWTTSVLFFQVTLLLGYLYTHVATTRLRPRAQVTAHLVLFVVPAVALPLSVAAQPGDGGTLAVVARLLLGLALGVGAPFLLVSTSGPLLQRWFSWTDHPRAHDPYFLYAASNVGSILGLLTYPFVVEPWLDLEAQAAWWTGGYVVLGTLLLAASVWVRRPISFVDARTAEDPSTRTAARTPVREVATWVGLAFLPSSLMLGVTTFLSTDIAAVPLLWVVPLAVYLATFVVAFSSGSTRVARWARRLAAPVTLLAATSGMAGLPVTVSVSLAVGSFGVLAMVVHDRLASRRPPADRLTQFYVWMSVGGALGGVVNGVLAPLLLPGPFEFAIVGLAAAIVVGRSLDDLVGGPRRMAFWVSAVAVVGGVLGIGVAESRGWVDRPLLVVLVAVLTAILAVTPAGRSKLAVVSTVALLTLPSAAAYLTGGGTVERSFFGSYRVATAGGLRSLYSGTTLHGLQSLATDERDTPLSYYHPDGPLGDWLPDQDPDARIGVVGLGAGSVAAYTTPGQTMVFHEIDPTVVDVAARHFTFLADAAGEVDVVLGDGRLTVAELPGGDSYDVLVVDAFSSDSIPVHLLTEEAFEGYRRAVAEDGVLLVHISNRYLDLEPVVAAAADAVGLHVRTGRGDAGDDGRRAASAWMAMSPHASRVAALDEDRWRRPPSRRVAWTDAFSNLVTVLRR